MTERTKYFKKDWTWRAAGVLILDGDKVLAFNRAKRQPGLALPCGFVEPREPDDKAAIRECYEETGYRVRILEDAPYVSKVNNVTVTTYKAVIEGWQDNPSHPEEGMPEWHTVADFMEKTVFYDYNMAVLKHFGVSEKKEG